MRKKRVDDRNQNTRGNLDNRSKQLNPNNDVYWKSRGYDKKPTDKNTAPSKKENENNG